MILDGVRAFHQSHETADNINVTDELLWLLMYLHTLTRLAYN